MLVIGLTVSSVVACHMLMAQPTAAVGSADGSGDSGGVWEGQYVRPMDPCFGSQWGLSSMNAPQAWCVTEGDETILVGVIDTGIDADHEDLVGKVACAVNLSTSPVADDVYGHGTHIAGTIAALSYNGVGICGIAPACRLANVKVTDDGGRCGGDAIADGIVWAVDNGVQVLNISLCLKEPCKKLEEAVNYAWRHGAVVVAAAGNGGDSTPQFPAYYENCLAVTAIKEDGARAPLAAYGDWVDVAAPGYQVYSTLPGDEYGCKTGTSQAVAHVSGLAALLYSIAEDGNGNGRVNDEVRAVIESGCRALDEVGMGRGCVDAELAIQLLEE